MDKAELVDLIKGCCISDASAESAVDKIIKARNPEDIEPRYNLKEFHKIYWYWLNIDPSHPKGFAIFMIWIRDNSIVVDELLGNVGETPKEGGNE